MRIENIMTKNPVTADVSATCEEVAGHMRDKGVGCVITLRNGKAAGLITDRMLATHVLADGRDASTPVEDVMIENPGVLSPDDTIFHAVDAMRSANLARRLPVVNAYNELVGVVSISDIAVVAKDLIDAVLLEETHHSLKEAKVQTGAKRMVKEIRRPTKDLPRQEQTHTTTEPTPPGQPTKRGNVPRTKRQSTS